MKQPCCPHKRIYCPATIGTHKGKTDDDPDPSISSGKYNTRSVKIPYLERLARCPEHHNHK
ncbi:hypothetical protein, partial [Segatella hominis]|uniref:hypothetical protein n=1 Tax=Segatella hominis TaxID=2518605 RepID=UPI0021C635A6